MRRHKLWRNLTMGPRLCALALVAAHLLAQPSDRLVFEVASIKPSDPSGQGSALLITPGGGLNGRNLTLRTLIQRAYGLLDFQISDGPAWINSERYDIQAKALRNARDESVPNDLSKLTPEQGKIFQDQFLERLRTLLTDRFQVKFRRETKDLPVYALVVAKGGPKIHEATGGKSDLQLRKSQLDAKGVPIANLTRILSQRLGRSVLDATGLTGTYDFTLQWAPDPTPAAPDNVAAPELGGPSIFTAVEEQLGLKLESKRGPVDIFVIEHAERPSEN
jgi:bla regulator protein blaR1